MDLVRYVPINRLRSARSIFLVIYHELRNQESGQQVMASQPRKTAEGTPRSWRGNTHIITYTNQRLRSPTRMNPAARLLSSFPSPTLHSHLPTLIAKPIVSTPSHCRRSSRAHHDDEPPAPGPLVPLQCFRATDKQALQRGLPGF